MYGEGGRGECGGVPLNLLPMSILMLEVRGLRGAVRAAQVSTCSGFDGHSHLRECMFRMADGVVIKQAALSRLVVDIELLEPP